MVASNAGDTAVVAWESARGDRIQARVLRVDDAGEAWSPTVDLGDRAGTRPAVAADASGTAVVVWEPADRRTVELAAHDGGGWTTATVAVPGAGVVRDPRVGVDGSGIATIVARAGAGDRPDRIVTVRRAAGAVGAVEVVGTGAAIGAPRLGVSPDGTTAVAWTSGHGRRAVVATVRRRDGRWSAPTRLGEATDDQLAVSADGDGTATAIWLAPMDDGVAVMTSWFDGARWSTAGALDRGSGRASDLVRPGPTARDPAIAPTPDGPVAAWAVAGADGVVRAASRRTDGGWTAPVALSAGGGAAGGVTLATLPGAAPTVGWEEIDGDLLRARVAVADDPAGCRDVSPPRGEVADLALAGGLALAVYTDLDRGRIVAVRVVP